MANELEQNDKLSIVEVLILGGQIYAPLWLTENRKGFLWGSRCANCGKKFTFATPLIATVENRFDLSRRCTSCAKPGKKVVRLKRWVKLSDYADWPATPFPVPELPDKPIGG